MGVSYKNAERLVRTELNFVSNIAAAGPRTCSTCSNLNGTIHLLSEFEAGTNAPPMHPRCRCTISAVVGSGKKVPAGFKRQQHFSTSNENISATNPNYSKGIKYQRNCQRCVPAYEMRMRGYDVVAKPAVIDGIDEFAEYYWDKVFENAIIEKISKGDGKDEIIAKMIEWGDGARAEVYIKWISNDDFGHVFVAENRFGEIHFLDPQNGTLDVEYYFDTADNGFTKFFRIDNLEPNELFITECCKEAAK